MVRNAASTSARCWNISQSCTVALSFAKGMRRGSCSRRHLACRATKRRGRAAEAEGDEGAEEAAAAAAAAAAGERSTPSSASSLASGFVRDRQAELEALSYISSSSSSRVSPEKEEEEEEKEHHHGRNHHHNNNRERSPQTPTAPPMPLARRAEIYRRAWLAAVDEILSKLVRESPGGSRYLTSDMGVRCCFLSFFFFFEREREGGRKK